MPHDSSTVSLSPPRRWQAAAVLLMALAWLALAAAVLLIGAQADLVKGNMSARDIALLAGSIIVQLAAPLAVVVLAAIALRRTGRDEATLIAALEARQLRASSASDELRVGLDAIDRALTGVTDRLLTLQQNVAGDSHGLSATARDLDTATAAMAVASRDASAQAVALQALVTSATAHAAELGSLLEATGRETTQQLGAVETMLAAAWNRNADASAQVHAASATMTELLAGIEASAARTTAALSERTSGLNGSVDSAFERISGALDATRDGVHAQTNALLASVDQARVALDHIGGESARAISKRLDRLNEAADLLGQRLSEQDARSRMLVETVERSFAVLDNKLGAAAQASHGTLDGIAAQMASVSDQLQGLNRPLGETHATMLTIEDTAGRLREVSGQVIDAMGRTLPTHVEGIAALSAGIAELHGEAARLQEPVAQGQATIDAAVASFTEQRASMEATAAKLNEQLGVAHSLVSAVQAQAEGSALQASAQLIEVLGRVREIAGTTAGEMRAALSAVITEAEAALEHAGTTHAEATFGTPIRGQLAAIEEASNRAADAAQGAADRVAQRLVGLTKTVAAVEARIDEVQTHFEVQARDDLMGRSTRLLDSLNAGSIDIAKLLAIDVGDQSWSAYLAGDRSVFTRRVVKLADAATARAVKRHYTHDQAFRELAIQYIDEFERLVKHVDADKDGRALAITLLSSDVGKLYVVLAQAIDRLR